jgi:hypothetical protein
MRYGFDTTDPLNDWLDEGHIMFESSREWPFLQLIATVAVGLGVNSATMPSDFSKIYSLRDTTNSRKLQRVDVHTWERMIENQAETGKTKHYLITGLSTVQLWPVPDTAISLRTIYKKQLILPSALASDATQLDGPTRIHYPVVLAAAYNALMAENEEDRAAQAMAQFENAVEKRWNHYSATDDDEPRQVQDVMDYFEVS